MCAPFASQARIIALIEIITSSISLIVVLSTTLVVSLSPSIQKEIYHSDPQNFFNIMIHFPKFELVPMVVLPIVYFIGELFLAVWLLHSVRERNYRRCRLWFIATITVCLTGLYFFIPGVVFTEDSYYFIVIFLASYLFTVYSVWVVHCFLKELKAEGLHRPITQWDDEIDKL